MEDDDGPWMVVASRTSRQQQDGAVHIREEQLTRGDSNRAAAVGAWSKQHSKPRPPRSPEQPHSYDHRSQDNHYHDDDHRDDSRHKVNPSDLIGAPVVMGVVRKSRDSTATPFEPKPSRAPHKKERGGLLRVDIRKVRESGDHVIVTKDHVRMEEPFDLTAERWPGIVGDGDRGGDGVSGGISDWSAAVKSKPRPQPRPQPVVQGPAVAAGSRSASDDDDGVLSREKKKKKRKKNKTHREAAAASGYTMDLGDIMERISVVTSKSSSTKPIPLFAMPVLPKPSRNKEEGKGRGTVTGHAPNMLDSSAPVTRRGKEREQPKKKKPSALRKVIDKEKEKRKQRLKEEGLPEEELKEGQPIPTTCSDVTETATVRTDHVQQVTASAHKMSTPPQLHNRRFRDYCTHLVTEDINTCTSDLLTDLVRFQDRVYKNEPQKLKTKRRYVCGLREVEKSLSVKLRKVECVIVTPNMDRIQSPGGVDDRVSSIIQLANQSSVPVVFALSRRRLAWVLKKSNRVACVTIYSYAGAEDKFHNLMSLVSKAREDYNARLHPQAITASPDPPPPIAAATSGTCVSGDDSDTCDSSDGDSADESAIPVGQWSELFSNSLAEGAGSTLPSTRGFSWNPNAVEFTPHFSPAAATTNCHDDHNSN